MPQSVDADLINKAYDLAGPQLKVRILEAIDGQPLVASLMIDIAKYIIDLRNNTRLEDIESVNQPSKKRKLDGNHVPNDKEVGTREGDEDHMNSQWHNAFQLPDVSFVVPQRKKLSLEIGRMTSEGIRAVTSKDRSSEFSIPWKDIEHAVCLPVPEKAAVAHNFCIFPRYGDGVTYIPEDAQPREPMVWTIPDPKVKETDPEWKSPRDSIIEFLTRMNVEVLVPSASEFVSEVLQAHRKGEKAYHVKAFRGSKDGFLFFLPTGIVWGFKKPLYFFSFAAISSISYTSVLQRTFNLNISTILPGPSSSQEFEFSMVDQADFAGIDGYVKKHQLQDASMAEQRRAKKLNINGVKGEKEAEDGNTEGELEKARREVEGQDDEDDEEEDDENFDPGSEGESEGSGDVSDEEDGGEGTREEGRLVEEELESEAEEEEF